MTLEGMQFNKGGIGEVVINMGADSIRIVSKGAMQLANRVDRTLRPYPKALQARKETPVRKSSVPDELKKPYESVEAGLLAVLGMASSEDVGDMGQGERGGDDTPYNNLQLLRGRLTNRQIADEFLNSKAMKEYRRDPFARDKVIAALGSLENAFPPLNAAS